MDGLSGVGFLAERDMDDSDKEERIRALQRDIAKLTAGVSALAGDKPSVTFREFAMQYLEAKLQRPTIRASTKKIFAHQVERHLIPAFGALPLEAITPKVFFDWMGQQKRITRFFNARKALIEIMRAAKDAGHIDRLPKIEDPDERRDVGRVLEDKEVHAILWHSRRPFRFIFYTFWRMGCRPREILQWRWDMLRIQNEKLWIDIPAAISKTGRSRSIPIDKTVARILMMRRDRCRPSPFCFPSQVDRMRPQLSYASAWRTACFHAKVKKCVPYDFRRSLVTRWAAEGKPLLYIAKFLDTSTVMLEKIYAKAQGKVLEDLIE